MQLDAAPDISDSDDELPVCRGLKIANAKPSPEPTVSASQRIESLKEIFENQRKIEEEIALSLQNKKYLESLVNDDDNSPTDVLCKHELHIDESWLKPHESHIDEHPGEPIFNLAIKGRFFSREQLTFENMDSSTVQSDPDLNGLSRYMIDEIIKRGAFLLEFNKVNDKQAALLFLFRLMSIHENYFVAVKCKQTLITLIEKNPLETKVIGLKEVLETLLNQGTTLQKLIPIPELLSIAEKVMDINAENVDDKEPPPTAELQLHCLEFIMNVLQSLVAGGNVLQEPDHLMLLVVLLCSLALDEKLRTEAVVVEIQVTIDVILQQFKDDDWTRLVVNLAKYLCMLSEIPQNLVFVSQMFFHSQRGHHLQRLTSYLMCHKVLGIPLKSDNLNDVLPQTALIFLKSVHWRKYSVDLCVVYNAIVLLNFSVGQNFLHGNWKIFKDLAYIIKKIGHGIREKRNSMDFHKIMELITNISVKWAISSHAEPKSQQKSLFSFLDSDKEMEL